MSTQSFANYYSTCNSLANAIRDIDLKVRMSEQNARLKAQYQEHYRKHENNIALCNSVIDKVKPLVGAVQKYINNKRAESMQNINNALRLAGEIIPDSAQGIHFKMDGDEAWLSTQDDLTVQNTEGGAFRQVSSSFVRAVVLASNPDFLQTIMLDEMFAHVSVENTNQLSFYLNVLCQDRQVICIEQKPEIGSNIDTTIYTFAKGTDYAEVKKQVVQRNEGVNSNAS